jgi:hypothetical protein
MHASLGSDAFPCPFCHGGQILLIGGTHACLYYRCAACAETWTAMPAAPPPPHQELRPTIH